MKIGFAWKGSPHHRRDRRRSTELALWVPLIQEFAAHQWYCLQGAPTEEEDRLLQSLVPPIVQDGMRSQDWLDTATYLGPLDLVLTVDTAVAHLAGVEAKPVWVLLAAGADFRWGYQTAETCWYPTMRLFRQPTMGDWASVFEDVAQHLRAKEAA